MVGVAKISSVWRWLLAGVILIISAVAMPAFAADPNTGSAAIHGTTTGSDICEKFTGNVSKPAGCDGQKLVGSNGTGYINTLVDLFIYAAGFVAFVFLLVGAFRYLASTGNTGRIQQAKDTVLYSIIGLIVVILARIIISFVIGHV
jgi:hypothetical protein